MVSTHNLVNELTYLSIWYHETVAAADLGLWTFTLVDHEQATCVPSLQSYWCDLCPVAIVQIPEMWYFSLSKKTYYISLVHKSTQFINSNNSANHIQQRHVLTLCVCKHFRRIQLIDMISVSNLPIKCSFSKGGAKLCSSGLSNSDFDPWLSCYGIKLILMIYSAGFLL